MTINAAHHSRKWYADNIKPRYGDTKSPNTFYELDNQKQGEGMHDGKVSIDDIRRAVYNPREWTSQKTRDFSASLLGKDRDVLEQVFGKDLKRKVKLDAFTGLA